MALERGRVDFIMNRILNVIIKGSEIYYKSDKVYLVGTHRGEQSAENISDINSVHVTDYDSIGYPNRWVIKRAIHHCHGLCIYYITWHATDTPDGSTFPSIIITENGCKFKDDKSIARNEMIDVVLAKIESLCKCYNDDTPDNKGVKLFIEKTNKINETMGKVINVLIETFRELYNNASITAYTCVRTDGRNKLEEVYRSIYNEDGVTVDLIGIHKIHISTCDHKNECMIYRIPVRSDGDITFHITWLTCYSGTVYYCADFPSVTITENSGVSFNDGIVPYLGCGLLWQEKAIPKIKALFETPRKAYLLDTNDLIKVSENLVNQPSNYGIFDPEYETIDTTTHLIFKAFTEAAKKIFTDSFKGEEPTLSPATDEYLFAYTYTRGLCVELACSKCNHNSYELWSRAENGIKIVIARVKECDSGHLLVYPYTTCLMFQPVFQQTVVGELKCLCGHHNTEIEEENKMTNNDNDKNKIVCGVIPEFSVNMFYRKNDAGEFECIDTEPSDWGKETVYTKSYKGISPVYEKVNFTSSIETLIKNVIFSDPVTTVIWKDGTKTIVRRQVTRYLPTITSTGCKVVPAEMIPFDPEAALAAAIMNKLFGSHSRYSRFVNGFVIKSEEKKKKAELKTKKESKKGYNQEEDYYHKENYNKEAW